MSALAESLLGVDGHEALASSSAARDGGLEPHNLDGLSPRPTPKRYTYGHPGL